jgi:hypothetical protein
MLKKFTLILFILGLSASFASAYCSKEETLKLIDAGYSKHEIDRICHQREQAPSKQYRGHDLRGSWRGFYSYERHSRRPDVPFHLVITHQKGKSFSGFIKEPQTFGKRHSRFLTADVKGRIDRENKIEFVKHYTGKGGVTHKVIYKGVIRRGSIKGRWFIPQRGSGTFRIQRER